MTPTSGDEPASGARPCSDAGSVTSSHSAPAATRARRPITSMLTLRMRDVESRTVSVSQTIGVALWPVPWGAMRRP